MALEQAKKRPEAIKEEIQSFIKYETWTLIPKIKIAATQYVLKRK